MPPGAAIPAATVAAPQQLLGDGVDVLVTGGAGFIGSHLVDRLLADGHAVRILDDLSAGRRENVAGDAVLSVGSVADADAVAEVIDGVEVVFHLAALGAVPRSVVDPLSTDRVNTHGTLTVLTAARDAGTRRVVFASSSSVYGGATVIPTPETVATRPRSPYGVSKLAGEWYCRVFADLFPLETVALALLQRVRPAAATRLDLRRGHPVVRRVVARRGATDGVRRRPPEPRLHLRVRRRRGRRRRRRRTWRPSAERSSTSRPGRSTPCSTCSRRSAARAASIREPIFAEARAGDIHQSCADATKAMATLGWRPQVPFESGIARYIDWLREGTS